MKALLVTTSQYQGRLVYHFSRAKIDYTLIPHADHVEVWTCNHQLGGRLNVACYRNKDGISFDGTRKRPKVVEAVLKLIAA